MKRLGGFRSLSPIAAALLLLPVGAGAQSTCNLDNPIPGLSTCGGPPTCAPACGASVAVSSFLLTPCSGGGGSFNLIGTKYESTGSSPCAGAAIDCVPPVRWWEFDNYDGANSGCPDYLSAVVPPIINCEGEFPGTCGPNAVVGQWTLYQANWQSPNGDGCIMPFAPNRTVADIAFLDNNRAGATEGTTNHFSWYALASVPDTTGGFNFDAITGGNGNCAQDVRVLPVGFPTGGTKTAAATCQNNSTLDTTMMPNGTDPTFRDLAISIPTLAQATWFTEGGMNGAPALVAGYEILWATSATEPTSSNPSLWQVARDSANLANKAFIPVGSGTATISVPQQTTPCWFSMRIIYADASLNTPPFPATGLAPELGSLPGAHCGPFACGGIAVEFDYVKADRTAEGVAVTWRTITEDDTAGYIVYRSLDANGTEAMAEAGRTEALGAHTTYEVVDRTVAGDASTTYYYVVQEITSSGFGDRSAPIRVDPAGATGVDSGPRTGGRLRGTATRVR